MNFSRKSYVYLMTHKIKNVIQHQNIDLTDYESIKSVFRGYYLYLLFRPFVGLVIGRVLYLFVMAGLITFIKLPVNTSSEVSISGRYFIYIFSFLEATLRAIS